MGFWTTVASLVIAAASSSYSAYAANDNAIDAARAERKAAGEKAAREKQAAAEAAAQSRDAGERLKSEQAAALAGAGVNLDSGTAGTLLSQTDRLAEQDALAALRGGNRAAGDIISAGNARAEALRGEGTSAAISGGLNFASTALNNYGAYQRASQNSRTAGQISTRTGQKYTLLGSDT
jgi:hypothetical protein